MIVLSSFECFENDNLTANEVLYAQYYPALMPLNSVLNSHINKQLAEKQITRLR